MKTFQKFGRTYVVIDTNEYIQDIALKLEGYEPKAVYFENDCITLVY